MKQEVLITLRGTQTYAQEKPESVELMTRGTMTGRNGKFAISYEETELTGVKGTTTTFLVFNPKRVVLSREGTIRSRMVFEEGVAYDSLYQMPFGALMLTVKATRVFFDLVPDGGVIDLSYNLIIENSEAGVIDYHLDIRG